MEPPLFELTLLASLPLLLLPFAMQAQQLVAGNATSMTIAVPKKRRLPVRQMDPVVAQEVPTACSMDLVRLVLLISIVLGTEASPLTKCDVMSLVEDVQMLFFVMKMMVKEELSLAKRLPLTATKMVLVSDVSAMLTVVPLMVVATLINKCAIHSLANVRTAK
jgi:hypothetical protein